MAKRRYGARHVSARWLIPAVVGAVLGMLAVSASAASGATVTLGATDLSATGTAVDCSVGLGGCTALTLSQTGLPEPGTVLIAPRDGVITAWRIHGTIAGAASAELRVLHPAGGGQFTGAGTSAAATALDGSTSNPTSLPIHAGDYIGVDLRSGGSQAAVYFRDVAGAASNFWSSALGDGSTASPTSSTTNNEAFEFNATEQLSPPTVSGVSPGSGSAAGGQTVTITGAHLAGATAVTFGAVAATSFSGTDDQITAISPAEAAGTVDVRVTTPAGASAPSPADRFTFISPAAPGAALVSAAHVFGASVKNNVFRAAPSFKRVVASRRVSLGTTFKFSLDKAAAVRFDFTQPGRGRKVNGRCVAQNKHNKRTHSCARTLIRGSLTFAGHAGRNSVRFYGWLSKHKKLKPGKYTLVITATTPGAGSTSQKLTFTIVK